MADSELNRRLERLGKVLLDAPLDRSERKAERRAARAEKRALRREHEHGEPSFVSGGVMVAVAVALAVMGILNPHKFWLLFVALGLGLGGGKQIELALRRGKLLRQGEPAKEEPVAPQVDRAELLCDQLLSELKDSPAAVREFLGKPEETVEAIRAACRQLKQRQQLMLEAVAPERAAELEHERKQLEQRLGHLDETTYRRATDALKQRQELFNQVRSTSEKIESERQILLTTLESLRMRVVLAKGAGGQGGSLDDMKREVDRLSDELSAITDALETVQRGELQPIAPIEAGGPGASGPAQRERS